MPRAERSARTTNIPTCGPCTHPAATIVATFTAECAIASRVTVADAASALPSASERSSVEAAAITIASSATSSILFA